MPPTKIAFLHDNKYAAAATAYVASSAVLALPAAATRNPDRTFVWRSLTQTGVQTIDVDLGTVMTVSAIAVANVKLLGAGILELYERGDGGGPDVATLVVQLPAADRDTRTAFAFFTAQAHRHWQLKWTNPSADNDYAELGYAFLGQELVPTFNVRVPADIARMDPAAMSVSVDGQKSFARRTKFARGAWEFTAVPEAQLSDLRALFNTLGVSGAMFMVLDTALAWSAWYAQIAGEMTWQLESRAGSYSVRFPWEEVR
jgi:hypothetical protein